jgi:PAS domain S-box-containing protein
MKSIPSVYHQFVDASPFAMASHTLIFDDKEAITDYIFEEVNELFVQLSGIPREKLIGKKAFELFATGKSCWLALYLQIAQPGSITRHELYIDELNSWFQVQVKWVDTDRVILYFSDVTQLKTNAGELETFFHIHPDMFCIADVNGNFIIINNVWEKVLGYSPSELLHTNYMNLVHPDDIAITLEAIELLKKQESVTKFTNRYRCKSGEYRYVEWSSKPYGDHVYSSSRDVTDHKLQEEKIEGQEKFRQIVDNMDGVFWLLSLDKRKLLYLSSGYTSISSVDPFSKEHPYDVLMELVHPDDSRQVAQALEEFDHTGVFTGEFRLISASGKTVWVSSKAFPVYDERGELIRFAGYFQNNTARKMAELALYDKTNRLNAILKALPDTIFTISADGVYLDFYSSEPEKLIAEQRRLIGSRIAEYFSEDMTRMFMEAIHSSIEGQQMQRLTYQLELRGEQLHFETRIIPIDSEKVLLVVRDLTELAVKDEKLNYQAQLQKLLVRISNNYINVSFDQLDTILLESMSELGEFIGADRFYVFEYQAEEHTFRNTHEWCAPGIEPLIDTMQSIPDHDKDEWIATHSRGETLIIEDVMLLKEDDPIRLLVLPQQVKSLIAVPLFEKEAYVGFVGIDYVRSTKKIDEDEQQLLKVFAQTIMSVRQRIGAHRELTSALEQATESDRLKSAFLATISHELRTPLNHILGFGSLIRDHSSEEYIRDFAGDIYTSGNLLLHMIEDMFALALAEKSAMVLRQTTIKGVELYMGSKSLLQEMLNGSGKSDQIKLEFKPDPGLMTKMFIADRQKILQVLSNLFSNAVKFTHSGSIEFGIYQIDNAIEMYVKDTGIGIPADQQLYVFDLFRQLDDGHDRRFGGLGVGLAISRKLAEVLNASLWVDSSPGNGACFYFYVPVQFIE